MIRKPPTVMMCHWIFLAQERYSQEEAFPQGWEFFLTTLTLPKEKKEMVLRPNVQHGSPYCLENSNVWASDRQEAKYLIFQSQGRQRRALLENLTSIQDLTTNNWWGTVTAQ